MFGFLKRPEDVQNEFVAVERGKSPTNPDCTQRLFWLFCSQKSPWTCGRRWPKTRTRSGDETGPVLVRMFKIKTEVKCPKMAVVFVIRSEGLLGPWNCSRKPKLILTRDQRNWIFFFP